MIARLRRDESGLSMAEILVSTMLTLLILAMVGSFFIQTTQITMASNQTTNSNNVASNVANEVTSVLRVATTLAKNNQPIPDAAIVSGTRNAVTLYSLSNTDAANPAPVRIALALDTATGTVTETRCTAVASAGFWTFGACGSTSTRTLGVGVLAPTGESDQLFTYYDVNGAPMVIGTGELSSAERPLVASVRVYVRAQAPGSETDPVVISNTVVLGNLGLDTGS